jgi:hypothetical protein
VRCPSCHREERVRDGVREVVTEGGQRRPAGSPQVAALEILLASMGGALPPVVGTCPACGQPLVGGEPRAAYAIPVPGGAITLGADGSLTGPAGPLVADAARDLVRRAWPEEHTPLAERAFAGIVLLLMLVPAAIGAFMVYFVFLYLSRLGAA